MSTNAQNPVSYSITRIASETERLDKALKLLVQTRKWLFRQSRALSMFGKSDQSTLNRPDYAFQRLQPTRIESIGWIWMLVTYARRRLWLLTTLITTLSRRTCIKAQTLLMHCLCSYHWWSSLAIAARKQESIFSLWTNGGGLWSRTSLHIVKSIT